MSKYSVKIERISSRHHGGFRYMVTVTEDGFDSEIFKCRGWSLTRLGAKVQAKQIIKKLEDIEPEPKVVEEYQV